MNNSNGRKGLSDLARMLVAATLWLAMTGCMRSSPEENVVRVPAGPASRTPAVASEPPTTGDVWRGSAAGWDLRLELAPTRAGETIYFTGSAASNKPECLRQGSVQGASQKGVVTLVVVDVGNVEMVVDGTMQGNQLTGYLEVRSGPAGCTLLRTPVLMSRAPS